MSFHNKPDYHIPELIEALKAHRLPHDTPSQLADSFRIGWMACRELAQTDSVQEDAARLDWLEQNLFHREKDEWDTKFGGYKEYNMWVLFSPKGIQGSARNIIDAAREQGASHDR